MIRSLPVYERKNSLINEVFDAESKQIQLLQSQTLEVREQLFVDTATWGLKVYERELEIVVPSGSTLESRRSVIKAKWRSDGKADKALLEAVASAILKTKVSVGFDGRILLFFEVDKSKVDNLNLMHKVINEVKPAHLPHVLEARVSSNIVIHGKYYNFGVPYKITNMFQTANVPGGLAKSNVRLNDKAYGFDVLYPIANAFVTSTITSENVQINTILTGEYRDNDILYKRVGSVYTGEGVI